ncbi:unnamed protein product [Vicia faba]|uniref:Uncharacterized protein n=1 Tax=Vicia faba TaxID=3906 RepID=A0AAV0ZNS8_VICFA|nr:unnamed protein product [Vicia faba]
MPFAASSSPYNGGETPYFQSKLAENSTSFSDPRHRCTTTLSPLSQILNLRSSQHCDSQFRPSFSTLSRLISAVIDIDRRAHAHLARMSHGALLPLQIILKPRDSPIMTMSENSRAESDEDA